MLEICIQTSYDQNVQLILKSYLPVVYGTTLTHHYYWWKYCTFRFWQFSLFCWYRKKYISSLVWR